MKAAHKAADMVDRFGFWLCGERVPGISERYYYGPLLFELQLQTELLREIELDTVNIVELGRAQPRQQWKAPS